MKALAAAVLSLMAVSVMAQAPIPTGDPAVVPGAKAPPLKVHAWLKGTPVKEFKKGEIHVIEFWATWCGPCITSIPHVTELAKKYQGKVRVTGVSVWERPWDQAKAQKFVDDMGAKMDYNVAIDTQEGVMADTWMQAAEQNGIPAAFIVKDGIVQWVGHPMSMDEPLKQVVEGKFNVAEAKKTFMAEIEQGRAQARVQKELAEVKAVYAKDKAKALKRLDEIAAMPGFATDAYTTKLMLLSTNDIPGTKAEIVALIAKGEEGQMGVAMFAIQSVRTPAVKDIALEAAATLSSKATSWMTAYYAAAVYGQATMKPEAKAAFEKALSMAEKMADGAEKADIIKFLKEQIAANSTN
jgi:thiol-disulfide isomerase/thioredoxin